MGRQVNVKPKRIVDKHMLGYVRLKPCVCCRRTPSNPHHVTTIGAGGHDVENNLMPLCFEHHVLIHQYGISKMISIFPEVLKWLEDYDRVDVIAKLARS